MPTTRHIVFISDLHVGSVVGLWPERHPIEGGGIYEASVYQQWLYKCWLDCCAEVRAMRPRPTVILLGDLIQGVNTRDGQVIGGEHATQVSAARVLLAPIIDRARVIYVVRGTEWHDGKAAEHLELLARELGAVQDPTTGQYSRWELYLNVGGPVIHAAHHVGMSSVPWYEATVPLRDGLMELAELWRFYGEKAPNVRMVARAHRHRFIHVQAPPDFQVFVTPGWQLKCAFAHKAVPAMLAQLGYVVVDWDGTDLVVKPRIYELPALHVEALS